MTFSKWNALLLLLVFAFSVSAESPPQQDSRPPGYRIHRSIPPPGAKTHVVVLGERFRAGGFKRWIYGYYGKSGFGDVCEGRPQPSVFRLSKRSFLFATCF